MTEMSIANSRNIVAHHQENTQLPLFFGRRFCPIDDRMNGGAITLATIFGTKVRMHLTFPLLLVWVAAMEGVARGTQAAIIGVVFVMLLFACVVAHEFGHVLVARHFGGRTRDILLLPIGGVSRMDRMPESPRDEFAVALAGPAVSIGIGLSLAAIAGFPTATSIQGTDLAALLPRLAAANLFLAFFNLLPAFPMDGGRAVRAALSIRMGHARATRLAAYLGHAFGVLFGMVGLLSGNPIILLIGIFIYFGASAEAAGAEINEMARFLTVSDVMRTNVSTIRVDAHIADAVAIMFHSGQHAIPVTEFGKIVGVVTKDGLIRALDRFGRTGRLTAAMEPNVPIVMIDEKLTDAIARMRTGSAPALVVVDRHDDLAGMISIDTLADLMLLQAVPDRHPLRVKAFDPRLTISVPRAT